VCVLETTATESNATIDRRRLPDRRITPRGGRRADDPGAHERKAREQQVDRYLRKQRAAEQLSVPGATT
jgi:hypothetical protein